jgi:hypothetical protein
MLLPSMILLGRVFKIEMILRELVLVAGKSLRAVNPVTVVPFSDEGG